MNVGYIRSVKFAHSNYQNECSLSDSMPTGHKKLASANADSASLASTLTEAHEEAESGNVLCSWFYCDSFLQLYC